MDTCTEKKLLLRLPTELHAPLQEMAKEDLRSVHSEIIFLIREALMRRGFLVEVSLHQH